MGEAITVRFVISFITQENRGTSIARSKPKVRNTTANAERLVELLKQQDDLTTAFCEAEPSEVADLSEKLTDVDEALESFIVALGPRAPWHLSQLRGVNQLLPSQKTSKKLWNNHSFVREADGWELKVLYMMIIEM